MNVTITSNAMIEDLISERLIFVMSVAIRVCLNSALTLASIATNIINSMVFWQMGIDHSTESFFILSLADFFTGVDGIFGTLSNGFRYLGPPSISYSMHTFHVIFLIVATIPSHTSMISTTVIAVVRCCSVALPFQVRTIFTARRQRVFILLCTVVVSAFLIYGWVGTRVIIRTHPRANISYLALAFHPDYIARNRFSDYYRGVMFYVSFSIISACMVTLIIALRRAYKFRNVSYKAKNDMSCQNAGNDGTNALTSNEFKGFKSGSKEAQVVTVVLLVSAIFTICNIPAMILSIFRQAVPGLSNIGTLRRSYDFGLILAECFQLLSASVNIIVYLRFNTRYYTAFLRVMRRGK